MKLLLAAIFCAFGLLACSSDDGASTSASATATPRLESTAPVVMSTLPVLPTATTAAPAPTATVAAPPPATATTVQAPAQPTTPPQPTAPPAPQGAAPPVTFNVTAKNSEFTPKQLTARAGAMITVNFTNDDLSMPHNLYFSGDGSGHSATCIGPCKDTYTFTAPGPGPYLFFCNIHLGMEGSFTVSP